MDVVGNIINDNDDASDSKVLPGWFKCFNDEKQEIEHYIMCIS